MCYKVHLQSYKYIVLNENILVLAVIDLPDLGGSKLISDQGYSVETLVGYSDS